MLMRGKNRLSHLFIQEPNNLQTLGASIELFVVFTQLLRLYLLRNLLCFLFLYLLVSQSEKMMQKEQYNQEKNEKKKQPISHQFSHQERSNAKEKLNVGDSMKQPNYNVASLIYLSIINNSQ